MEKILYTSFEAIKEAVNNGILVNWSNGLYFVKKDFYGDFVVKCTASPMQERLSDSYKLEDFFTVEIQ